MNEDLAVAFPAFPFWRRGASLPCSGCQYIRGQPEEKTATRTSADGLEVRGGQLAAALIRHQVELDLLSFDQMIETSLFDGADMDECILAPSSGSMKPKPFAELNHFTVPIDMRRTLSLHKLTKCTPARCWTQRTDRRICIDFRSKSLAGAFKVSGAAKSSVRLSTRYKWALRAVFARPICNAQATPPRERACAGCQRSLRSATLAHRRSGVEHGYTIQREQRSFSADPLARSVRSDVIGLL
jgi:hypothetical protein